MKNTLLIKALAVVFSIMLVSSGWGFQTNVDSTIQGELTIEGNLKIDSVSDSPGIITSSEGLEVSDSKLPTAAAVIDYTSYNYEYYSIETPVQVDASDGITEVIPSTSITRKRADSVIKITVSGDVDGRNAANGTEAFAWGHLLIQKNTGSWTTLPKCAITVSANYNNVPFSFQCIDQTSTDPAGQAVEYRLAADVKSNQLEFSQMISSGGENDNNADVSTRIIIEEL